jgi:hypothetical protein
LQITVRDGKGGKDRVTMLPVSLVEELRRQIAAVNLQHRRDLAAGLGEVWLPHASGVKKPGASREFAWQFKVACGSKGARASVNWGLVGRSTRRKLGSSGHKIGASRIGGFAPGKTRAV